jgi:hypothetical protein
VTKLAVVIHLGESEVFEGEVTDAVHGVFDVDCPGAHLFEERAELVLIHEARITEGIQENLRGIGAALGTDVLEPS